MQPNERAIQSRAKEAFGLKINSQLWDMISDVSHQISTNPQIFYEEMRQKELHKINKEILPMTGLNNFDSDYSYAT